MNPIRQSADPAADPNAWGRFDTRDGRTLYVAQPQRCAFQELLAPLRRRLGTVDSLAKDAQFLGLDADDLAQLVEGEWAERGHMRPGHLPAGWRFERLLYEFQNPPDGWWIDVEHADTIAAISDALDGPLAALGVATVDRSLLLGPDRQVTVAIASWARQLRLDDGSRPLGITWQSKHGAGRCWAYWMRLVDAGSDAAAEPLTLVGQGRSIARGDTALSAAAKAFGITVW